MVADSSLTCLMIPFEALGSSFGCCSRGQALLNKSVNCINKAFTRDTGRTGGTIDLTCPHLVSYGTMMIPLRETVKVLPHALAIQCNVRVTEALVVFVGR